VLFIDTHCHLNYSSFEQDLEDVIQRAADEGVYRIIVPGLNVASSRKAVQLAEKYQSIYAAVGIYPGDVDDFSDDQASEIISLAHHPKVVAIGEIGLDYFHRTDNQERQHQVFLKMLDIASSMNLPILIHSREALAKITQIVTRWREDNPSLLYAGIFHAFEGGLEDARQLTKLGFLLGAGGPVTYKNAKTKHEVFSKISLSYITLETDAPFLSPQKHRGARNEPAYIPIIANRIAELQGCSMNMVAEVTSSNVHTLFNWDD